MTTGGTKYPSTFEEALKQLALSYFFEVIDDNLIKKLKLKILNYIEHYFNVTNWNIKVKVDFNSIILDIFDKNGKQIDYRLLPDIQLKRKIERVLGKY